MKRRAPLYILLTLLVAVVLVVAGMRQGSIEGADYATLLQALRHYDATNPAHVVLVELRLPRLLLALLAGGGLALSGYLMQTMVNNPLADPYLLGTASGASLGALVITILLPASSSMTPWLVPVGSLAGAVGATLLVIGIGTRRGRLIPTQLLLAGVATASLFNALGGLITFRAQTDSQLRAAVSWGMGSLERAGWPLLAGPTVAVVLGMLVAWLLRRHLDVLLLGEERAATLGLDVGRTRWLLLLASSGITAGVVALCGPLGFVGLIIPHATRGLLGVTGRLNLAFCTLLGGTFLLACDLLARWLYPPAGLPVGLITALFGVPFFVYLLRKKG
ncbi:iron ABC transporter permease [Hymenobacter busanensis]|uniref:Iron ABC transporter permease n=1 Tax=Hymenobacter busanensis TaxID=2607656 RepID=A0A7L5A1U3_9BACT|nr:iron ABC transporter permease [Hymenobacter busanensis]KAA9338135.1 iron ABC transporter permease [Hymenobacter busanensis]QHJ09441.1 iron chelate uptake ABC transporter family permease subunit [Hymenobacter busanensis]